LKLKAKVYFITQIMDGQILNFSHKSRLGMLIKRYAYKKINKKLVAFSLECMNNSRWSFYELKGSP